LNTVIDTIRSKGAFLTADELSELLSLSRKHIYKLAKGGRIPHYRLGGTVRFDPKATAEWLEERSVAA
jgi:excisionase family DNA binding protein